MRGIVVTEGPADIAILRKLIETPGNGRIQFYEAGGFSAVNSLARSLLVKGSQKLAVVVDADSRDPNVIEDRKRFLAKSLRDIAPRSQVKVVVIAPEIEALFFEHRDILDKLLGKRLDDTEFVSGYVEPKKVLQRHLSGAQLEFRLDTLEDEDLESLRSDPEISSLRAFLN